MPTFELNKIVRTGLPDIYRSKDQVPEIEIVVGAELVELMLDKLREELTEYSDGERTLEGLSDIQQAILDIEQLLEFEQEIPQEVIDAKRYIVEQMSGLGSDAGLLESARQMKIEQKGGFIERNTDGGYIGKKVTTLVLHDNDPWARYYRNEPDRFSEISGETHT